MSDEARYTIKIAAQLSGMHEQSLRLYERRGLIAPARSKGNLRRYSDEDIEQIRFIKRLIHDLGVNLAGVEVIIQLRRQIIELRSQLGHRDEHPGVARESCTKSSWTDRV